ncbi:hypothetical protein BDM02DRAFT_3182209 [Thelephora ganbajun]|uniref:Uncharacterized protein n=1 Tax=Thelephora ganbajun TaxID=370292 RepID=A0ACB6ZYQ3_THEGA|nr:hypothetical protein BDM02DRAFT_3182209 [Thelephora ganbajun]
MQLRAVVVANNEGMQLKIDTLTARVQELERALQDAQRSTANSNDPMLEDSPASPSSAGPSSVENGSDRESHDSYGTLSLGTAGDARFFGPTARSDYLAYVASADKLFAPIFPNISKTIVDAATFHDTIPTRNSDDVRRQLLGFLPTREDAERLCDLYLEYGRHIWDGIPREELYEEVLDSVYNQKWEINSARSAHAFSLLYTVFALATLFDTTKTPGAVEAEEYYMLASAAMSLAPPAMHTTLWGIHALLQMTWYLDLSDRDSSHRKSSQAWTCLGLAIRLAHGIGLHINPIHWELDEKIGMRRCRLFWQLFVKDTFMSCAYGRPPLLSPAFIDCVLPNTHSDEYQPWLMRYTKLLHNMMVSTFGSNRPSYQLVLQFDTAVRNFPIVRKMDLSDCAGTPEDPLPPAEVNIVRWLGVSGKESTLLHLHKPYFYQVLADQPGDILKHKYAPSFIAVFRSAWRLIRGICLTFERVPEFLLRAGFCWSHAADAAVVMCLVATRVPSSYLVQSAVDELDRMCACLDEAERSSSLVGKYTVTVNNLRKQANAVLEKRKLSTEVVEELDRLGGQTRVVKPRSPAGAPPPSGSTHLRPPLRRFNSHTSTSLQESLAACWEFENLHPIIIEDLKAFETISSNSTQQSHTIDFPSSCSASSTVTANSLISRTPELPIPIFSIPEQFNVQGELSQNLPSNRTANSSSPFEGSAQGVHVHQHVGHLVLNESSGPPALDPSWRSFVEHLGF